MPMHQGPRYGRIVGWHLFPHVYHQVDNVKLFGASRRVARAFAMVWVPSNYPGQMHSAVAGGQQRWQAGVRPRRTTPCGWQTRLRRRCCVRLRGGIPSRRPSFSSPWPAAWWGSSWLQLPSSVSFCRPTTSNCTTRMTWLDAAPNTVCTRQCKASTRICLVFAAFFPCIAGSTTRTTTGLYTTCTCLAFASACPRSALKWGRVMSCVTRNTPGRPLRPFNRLAASAVAMGPGGPPPTARDVAAFATGPACCAICAFQLCLYHG